MCLYGLRSALGNLLGTSLDYETYSGTYKKLDAAVRWQDISWQDLANRLGKKIKLVVFRRNRRSPIGLSPSVRRVYRLNPSKGIDPERIRVTQESLAWGRSVEGLAYVEKLLASL
ncbi:MAG: hypothetical protein WCL23_02590 [Candidatus Moraniibacteriota bacterium]